MSAPNRELLSRANASESETGELAPREAASVRDRKGRKRGLDLIYHNEYMVITVYEAAANLPVLLR
jgi:hypothetical protein